MTVPPEPWDVSNIPLDGEAGGRLLACLEDILQRRALTSLFQPIVDLRNGDIIGYEGLIRGPSDSLLHLPDALFAAARRFDRTFVLERLCRQAHADRFRALGLKGRLFLNASPEVLLHGEQGLDALELYGPAGRAESDGIVIELTESAATSGYDRLRRVVDGCRSQGMQIAIDDLGEGFSSLRLWSELRPEFVKIDKYFIRSLENDPVNRQFVRSILEIAQQSRACVIAEGIETQAELEAVMRAGITVGQGYLLGRPCANPAPTLAAGLAGMLSSLATHRGGQQASGSRSAKTVRNILREVPSVGHDTPTNAVYDIFKRQPELQVLVVLQDDAPVGLINRLRMLERLARPYHRELYGGKPCAHFIEHEPLVVDHATSLQDLGYLITESNPRHLADGFIITQHGRCLGVGTGQDLIREITQMQLNAARYANPLTQLPGNVPINEHIESLLQKGLAFSVCHCDLDSFKPFNDLYGYRSGDEVIQITASLLCEHADPSLDFVGHVGGDDFIVIFRSPDWRERCERILARFPEVTRSIYKATDLTAGGYVTRNRQGLPIFHDLVSISLGAAPIPAHAGVSSHVVAELAGAAKAQAKKIPGNALFVERRNVLPPAQDSD